MSRRVSLAGVIVVVVIWCGVLLMPSLHVMLRGEIKPAVDLEWGIYYDKDKFERLVREHPNDPRVLAIQAENLRPDANDPTGDHRKLALRTYDDLIEQFPRELWLIQNRLRLSTSGGLPIDDGEFTPPQPRRKNLKPWFSREEILQALKIAELGARLDPQNSFYDWMRAAFFFALKQPDDALRALADGAKKPHFDDGVLRDMQIRVEVQEMQRPLLWEERVSIIAAMLLPHYAIMRTTNRAAIWRGVLAENSGHHQRALEIYGNQMKLAAIMRRDSTNQISVLVAEALLRDSWGGLTRQSAESGAEVLGQSIREKLRRQTNDLSSAVADYAESHGRSDLAKIALREASKIDERLKNLKDWPEYFFGAEKPSTLQILGQSQWMGVILLRAMAVLVAGWIISSAASFVVPNARVPLSAIDVWASTLFPAIATAVVFFVALRLGVTKPEFLWALFSSDADTARNKEVLEVYLPYIEVTLIWMPLLLTILYCGVATLWRARKNPRFSEPRTQKSRIENQSVAAQIKSGLGWSAKLLGILALCYLPIAWAFWLMNLPSVGINNEIYFLTIAPLVLAVLVIFLWRQRSRRVINWPYMLAWSRSTLGALVVVGSVAYLSTLLLVLPLRRAADARLDDYIARGEVAVLRDIAARQK